MTGGSGPAREAEERPHDPGALGTREGTLTPAAGQISTRPSGALAGTPPGRRDAVDEHDRDQLTDAAAAPPAADETPAAAEPPADDGWDGYERRRPTTAEQAIPWLIGVILLLFGIVIVLLALIFTAPGGLGRARQTPTGGVLGGAGGSPVGSPVSSPVANRPLGSPAATPVPAASPAATAAATPAPQPSPTPTAPAAAEFGELEFVYLGRSAPLEPIYLLRKDFTSANDPEVLALAENGIQGYAWASSGDNGVVLASQRAVAIDLSAAPRSLADGITAVTLSPDGSTVYAVRAEAAGSEEIAHVLAIDFASGEMRELAAPRYLLPQVVHDSPLSEAQFVDEGGTYRLYWTEDGTLRLFVASAGVWQIDPEAGGATPAGDEAPTIWSPSGTRRIQQAESDGSTTLQVVDADGDVQSETSVSGLVSHVRWSADGDRVVFTLGRPLEGAGVVQDLFLWDLGAGSEPMQLTSTGAAFGAEWLGAAQSWRP